MPNRKKPPYPLPQLVDPTVEDLAETDPWIALEFFRIEVLLRTEAVWKLCEKHILIGAITPEDVRRYRQQRVGPKGRPLAIQTINHDHTALVHMLNVA